MTYRPFFVDLILKVRYLYTNGKRKVFELLERKHSSKQANDL